MSSHHSFVLYSFSSLVLFILLQSSFHQLSSILRSFLHSFLVLFLRLILFLSVIYISYPIPPSIFHPSILPVPYHLSLTLIKDCYHRSVRLSARHESHRKNVAESIAARLRLPQPLERHFHVETASLRSHRPTLRGTNSRQSTGMRPRSIFRYVLAYL